MSAGSAPGGFERPEIDLLDGLRLEYVAGVIRFFADVSDMWVAAESVRGEKYSNVVMVIEDSDVSGLEGAIEQLSDGEVDRLMVSRQGSEHVCYRFYIGSEGIESNFAIVCSEDVRSEYPNTRFYRI